MRAGGRGYPQTGQRNRPLPEEREVTIVNVQGEPVFDEVIRLGEPVVSLTDLIDGDDGNSRGLRGWRLA